MEAALFNLHPSTEILKNARIKIYPNCYRLTVFSSPVFTDGFEIDHEHSTKRNSIGRSEGAETRSDSARRARTAIFDISALNDWDYFVTLTLDSDKVDRYDPKAALKPFSKWLQNMVQRRDLRYLVVPEHHADGAIHFHGLVKGELNMIDSGTMRFPGRKKPIKVSTAKRLKLDLNEGQIVYNIADYKLGFSSAIATFGEKDNLAKYMTKYITKDLCKIFGNFYFAGGHDLRRKPESVDLNLDFDLVQGVSYSGVYGCVKYCTLPNDFNLLFDQLQTFGLTADDLSRGKVLTLYERSRQVDELALSVAS